MAKQTEFVKRKSLLGGFDFLNCLMFAYQKGKALSLRNMCGDLSQFLGIKIKKQSLDERFTEKAVAFLKSVLESVMQCQLKMKTSDDNLSVFNRVRIKDSTRFALPSQYSKKYRGHGGAIPKSSSMVSIQYEYDMLSGNAMDLRLTSGTKNDQGDSKNETHDIRKNDLFIRDLGYTTLTFMSMVMSKEAYFLNRLNTQTTAYYKDRADEKVDFTKCLKKMKKHNLPYLSFEVLLGKKNKIPCRMVLYRTDQSTYDKRIKKAKKHAKSKGFQVTKEYEAKSWLTPYVTNTSIEDIPNEKIKEVYGLRWQIELTFKVWKSQAKIHQVKDMKVERFECEVIAKLIWLLTHLKVFYFLIKKGQERWPEKTLSIWKYYDHAHSINSLLRKIICNPEKLLGLLEGLLDMTNDIFWLEAKKGKPTHYQALLSLT